MASLRNMSRKDKGDRITYESLWIHAKRHYDISGVAAYWRTRMVNEFRNALGGVGLLLKNRSSGLEAMWKPLQAKRISGAPTSTVLSGRYLFARRQETYPVPANSVGPGVSR